jgi:hypothetical protein
MHQRFDTPPVPPHELPRDLQLQFLRDEMAEKTKPQISGPAFRITQICIEEGQYFFIEKDSSAASGHSPGERLLKSIAEDPKRRLSPQEMRTVLQEERRTFKLHVNVPQEKRMAFIEELFDTTRSWNEAVSLIHQRDDGPVTAEKLRELGARLTWIPDWKVIGLGGIPEDELHDSQGHRFPDFIFYASGKTEAEAAERAAVLAAELSPIVRKYEADGERPGFSEAITAEDGYKHTSFSRAQGSGTFKLYLERTGQLDTYYDKGRDHALLKE